MRKQPFIFYGWVIAAIGFAAMFIVYGVRYSFPVFYVAILNEFGWSRGDTAAIFSINMFVYGISAPFAGALVDRFGPRRVLAISALVLMAATMAAGAVSALWQFYLIIGVVSALGMAASGYVPSATSVSNWFVRRRATALGIMMAGGSLSFCLGPPLEYLISTLGWRLAYVVLGIVVGLLIAPPSILFMRTKPTDMGLLPDGVTDIPTHDTPISVVKRSSLVVDEVWASTEWTLPKALKTYRLWALFFTWFFMLGIGMHLVLTHQVAFLVDVGYSQMFGAAILGLYGIANAIGRIGAFVSDRIGRENTYTVGAIGSAIGVIMLLLTKGTSQPWLPYAYAILFGLGTGLFTPTGTASVADLFQGKNLGSILGFVLAGMGFGGLVGPWLGGYLFDVIGNYELAFIIAILTMGVACAFLWIAAPRKVRLVAGKESWGLAA